MVPGRDAAILHSWVGNSAASDLKGSRMYSDTLGCLRAYKMITVTDIFGKTRMRKVSLGTEYSVKLDTAKEMVKVARNADSEPDSIGAVFSIGLY
jgi:hypothetical protein